MTVNVNQPETIGLSDTELPVVNDILHSFQDIDGALLPVLHAIQDALTYIPKASVPVIARALSLSDADVHGVITFTTILNKRSLVKTPSRFAVPKHARLWAPDNWRFMPKQSLVWTGMKQRLTEISLWSRFTA